MQAGRGFYYVTTMDKISRNIPKSLIELHKTLMGFQFKHEVSGVFDDFLSLNLQAWSRQGFPGLNDSCQKRYTPEERKQIGQMIRLHTKALQEGITTNGWFDALGTYYEAFASNWKKSQLGQFFTPEPICDLISHLMVPEGDFHTIGEPSCGSGRNILSAHCQSPRNFYHAQDIDPMCAKMCALNMLHHGCQGVVFCMDTLKNNDFRFGFAVNVGVHFGDVPNVICCAELTQAQHYWRQFERISDTCKNRTVEEPQATYLAA